MALAKSFIVIIILSVLLSIATKNVWNGVVLFLLYGVVKGIWRLINGR